MTDFEDRETDKSRENHELSGFLEQDIILYLSKVGFVERVMLEIQDVTARTRKTLLWGAFFVLNLFLLLLFGTSQPFIPEFFAFQAELAQFFFLFLGITFMGSLIGLVLSSDTSWLRSYLNRNAAGRTE